MSDTKGIITISDDFETNGLNLPAESPAAPDSPKELTEKQRLFLKALFSDEANGDIRRAMTIAGYSPKTPQVEVVKSLKKEIIEITKVYLATKGPEAAMALIDILYSPSKSGNEIKFKVAKEILDRIGVSEKNDGPSSNGPVIQNIIILPEKKSFDDERIVNSKFGEL